MIKPGRADHDNAKGYDRAKCLRQGAFAALLALAVSGCSALPSLPGTSEQPRTSAPRTPTPQARQCFASLAQAGAQFTPLPDRVLGDGCSQIGTVQLQRMPGDAGNFAVTNLGPVTCPVASAFAAWARFGVDRAARQILGSELVSIETFGSYACRNVAGSNRRSAHATSEAIDVSGFVLADGRRIVVQRDWNGGAAEREFLRVVQRSACKRFATVLGPDYNSSHADHFHFERVKDGRGFCR